MQSYEYWTTIGKIKYKELKPIAIRVFSIGTSSAAAERCWSIYGHIQSKVRNRLLPERAEKLVFIYMNAELLDENDPNNYFE